MTTETVVHWEQIHSIVNAMAEHFDGTWRQRDRKIGTGFLTIFLMKLCFSRTQSGYQIVIDEIWNAMKSSGVTPPQEKPLAASSVCEARSKLDSHVIHEMNREVVDSFLSLNHDRFRWNQRRLFVVDGSTIHLPPELKKYGFGEMNPGKHYPQGKLSVLLHSGSGIAVDVLLDNKGDERDLARKHLNSLLPDDVVLYDRGYFGYEMLLSHIRSGIDAIFRLPSTSKYTQIQEFFSNPAKPSQTVVAIEPSAKQKANIRKRNKNLECNICNLRLIRYFVNGVEYFLATTIMDEDIVPEEFADVYHKRWGVEEHYKACKSILSMESFHAKSLNGVLQEIYTAELLITLSRLIAVESESILSLASGSQKKVNKQMLEFLVRIYSKLKGRERSVPKARAHKIVKRTVN